MEKFLQFDNYGSIDTEPSRISIKKATINITYQSPRNICVF